MNLSLKSFVTCAVAFILILITTGCNHKQPQNSTATLAPPATTAAPLEPARPRVLIARDLIFNVPEDRLLSYSDGWKKVQADAEARAASFNSEEMKAQARKEILDTADKTAFKAQAQDNLRRLRLEYLQKDPDAAFVLGFYEGWDKNYLKFDCEFPLCDPRPPLVAHVKDLWAVNVTPTEMDTALTQILRYHDSEYQRDQELEYANLVRAALNDRQEAVLRAKADIYRYLVFAVVGDFRSELIEDEDATPENLSKQVRKAYLVDNSNGNILVELAAPWAYLHPQSSGAEK